MLQHFKRSEAYSYGESSLLPEWLFSRPGWGVNIFSFAAIVAMKINKDTIKIHK